MIDVGCPLCGGTRRAVLFSINFDPSRLDADTFAVKGKSRVPHYQINRCDSCPIVKLGSTCSIIERGDAGSGVSCLGIGS